MAVIAEFTLPSDAFPFGRAVSGDPTIRVSLERVVPTEQDRIPFFWATGEDFEEFERVLRESALTERVEVLARIDDSVLYHVEWDADADSFLNGLVDANGTILDAHGDSTWSFTVRFRNHADLTRFHQFYQRHDYPVHIDRVYSLSEEPGDVFDFGLTAAQREALLLAVETGYFDVPRRTTLTEIGEELGISPQAASEHVRRGAQKVLRKSLLGLTSPGNAPDDAGNTALDPPDGPDSETPDDAASDAPGDAESGTADDGSEQSNADSPDADE